MQSHNPLDFDAANAAEDSRREAAVLAAETERSDMEWLMGDARGRRLAFGQLSAAGVFRGSFDPTSALVTAFNEGRRASGLALLDRINANTPEKYQLMLQEGKTK